MEELAAGHEETIPIVDAMWYDYRLIDLPKLELDSLTDRKKLEEQLDKAKARFEDLKETVGFKSAA